MASLSERYNQTPKLLHHLLLLTLSQIKISVGTAATGHEKCIISGCSATPGSLRRLQWRKMLLRDGWALFLEICLNWSRVFDCGTQGHRLQWASYFRLNGCLSALVTTLSASFCFNLECLACLWGRWGMIGSSSSVQRDEKSKVGLHAVLLDSHRKLEICSVTKEKQELNRTIQLTNTSNFTLL